MKHKELTHIVIQDVHLGSGSTVLVAGTKVALLGSRSNGDGTWSTLVTVNSRWGTTGAIPADSLKKISKKKGG